MAAEIIQFTRTATPSPAAQAERLGLALQQLIQAMDAQRDSVASWRAALADLQEKISRLGDRLHTYGDALDHLQNQVGAVHAQAIKLGPRGEAALAGD